MRLEPVTAYRNSSRRENIILTGTDLGRKSEMILDVVNGNKNLAFVERCSGYVVQAPKAPQILMQNLQRLEVPFDINELWYSESRGVVEK